MTPDISMFKVSHAPSNVPSTFPKSRWRRSFCMEELDKTLDEITDSASKSSIGIQKCHKSNYADSDGRTLDIYINDGISHQTDSKQRSNS